MRSYRLLISLAFAAAVVARPSAAPAQTAPVATPSAAPTVAPAAATNPLNVRGYLRVYDFTRLNAIPGVKAVNQQSIEPGLSLHADYRLGSSRLSIGGSYLYATPFNGCPSPATHLAAPCGGYKFPSTSLNPDDTLPGYALNTFYEAYLQYKDARWYGKIGDQVITTPFANGSDSRLKPAAFQGAELAYTVPHGLSVDVMDMTRFESRTNSSFDDTTLLTAVNNLGSNPGLPAYRYFAGGHGARNGGFQYGRLGYAGPRGLATNVHYYHFDDIANLAWFDAKYTAATQKTKPFFALQAGRENNTGSALLGKIDSFVFGVQLGANVTKTVALSLGYDQIPQRSETVATPTGVTCSSKFVAGTKAGASLPYFIGSNAPSCVDNGNGTTTFLYGGLASPYTDSYATDPLFSTSISQGMVDRRAAGNGVKLNAVFTSPDKRLILIASRAYYDYGGRLGEQQTSEFDADAQYYLNALRKGSYKGLLLRYRYAEREQANTAQYGGAPYFKYNRAQLEYDF